MGFTLPSSVPQQLNPLLSSQFTFSASDQQRHMLNLSDMTHMMQQMQRQMTARSEAHTAPHVTAPLTINPYSLPNQHEERQHDEQMVGQRGEERPLLHQMLSSRSMADHEMDREVSEIISPPIKVEKETFAAQRKRHASAPDHMAPDWTGKRQCACWILCHTFTQSDSMHSALTLFAVIFFLVYEC